MKVNVIVKAWSLDVALFLEINLVREMLRYGTCCKWTTQCYLHTGPFIH